MLLVYLLRAFNVLPEPGRGNSISREKHGTKVIKCAYCLVQYSTVQARKLDRNFARKQLVRTGSNEINKTCLITILCVALALGMWLMHTYAFVWEGEVNQGAAMHLTYE